MSIKAKNRATESAPKKSPARGAPKDAKTAAAKPTKKAEAPAGKKDDKKADKKAAAATGKKGGKAAAIDDEDITASSTPPAVNEDEAEEEEETAASSSGGGVSASALAAAAASPSEGPGSLKNFRHHPDMENFYRFIYENDLRIEALQILDEMMEQRALKKAAAGGKPAKGAH